MEQELEATLSKRDSELTAAKRKAQAMAEATASGGISFLRVCVRISYLLRDLNTIS